MRSIRIFAVASLVGLYAGVFVVPGVSAAVPRSLVAGGSARAQETESPDEFARCSGRRDVDHQVLAGAYGPDPQAPFHYTKFYPERLQIRRGDVVEWCFTGGYEYHDVQFIPEDMDARRHKRPNQSAHHNILRTDEGGIAFNEEWLLGPELGVESEKCGRTRWVNHAPEDPCVLSSTDEWVGSNILDRIFGMAGGTAFAIQIDLPPGIYRYHCNLHPDMHGYIEVLPRAKQPRNPSIGSINSEIRADYKDAKRVFDRLSDPSTAYDSVKKEWIVRVGATTRDRDVSIVQFMPARLDVSPGDRVRFLAGTDEANTVTFPGGEAQGSFVVNGECTPHGCTGQLAPHGWVGTTFMWGCDPDAPATGAPMVAGAYIPPQVRDGDPSAPYGCVAGGTPEFLLLPHMAAPHRAPGDLVATPATFHNSAVIVDQRLPEWYRTYEGDGGSSGGEFGSEFEAVFPSPGVFEYACALHEYMSGVIAVE